jgi:type IV secretion system protein VirB10
VLQNTLNSKTAEPGDLVYCETIYPVVVDNRILVPVGSFIRGSVTQVKRPGRVKGRGEMHVRFDELTLPNGYTVKLQASLAGAGTSGNEEVDRQEGGIKSDSTKGEDIGRTAGTTAAGAGIGAIAGGGKGTAIGAAAGAAAGLAWTLLTRGREVEIPRGSTFDIILDRPLELDAAVARFEWTGEPSSLPAPAPRSQTSNRPIGSRIPF